MSRIIIASKDVLFETSVGVFINTGKDHLYLVFDPDNIQLSET
jgi:hypothetical protein